MCSPLVKESVSLLGGSDVSSNAGFVQVPTTSTDFDVPETDNVTDFAPEVAKEDADDALYSDSYSRGPPYLFNDNTGTA